MGGEAGSGGLAQGSGRGGVAVGADEADVVGVVEGVEGLGAEVQVEPLVDLEVAREEGIEAVDGRAAGGVAADDGAVDDGAVGGSAGVPAVSGACGEIVGQSAGEGEDTAELDFQRGDVAAAEDEAAALIVDRVGVFLASGKVGVVGVLAGGVGVDGVEGVGPDVAEECIAAAAPGVFEVDVERVVVEIAVVYIRLDGIEVGLGTARGVGGAGEAFLLVEGDPEGAGAFSGGDGAGLALDGADEG